MKKYLPLVFLSIVFVLLLLFLNNRSSLDFVDEQNDNPSPTSSEWQTYKNEKYGFEFQYPSNWTVSQTDKKIYVSTDKWRDDQPEGGSGFSLEIVNYNLDHFTQQYDTAKYIHPTMTPNCTKNCFTYSKLSFIDNPIISEIKSNHMTTETEMGIDVEYYFFTKSQNNYLINFLAGDDIATKILSTFKFTSEEKSPNTFCGGIAGIACPTGYNCILDGKYPDAGGKCQ